MPYRDEHVAQLESEVSSLENKVRSLSEELSNVKHDKTRGIIYFGETIAGLEGKLEEAKRPKNPRWRLFIVPIIICLYFFFAGLSYSYIRSKNPTDIDWLAAVFWPVSTPATCGKRLGE